MWFLKSVLYLHIYSTGPALEQELSVVEAQLPCCLPAEVRCFYRIHKGQVLNEAVGGLIGSVVVYQHHSSEYLMTVASQQMLSMIEAMVSEYTSRFLCRLPRSHITQYCCGYGTLEYTHCSCEGMLQLPHNAVAAVNPLSITAAATA